jgi:hypothetical protein
VSLRDEEREHYQQAKDFLKEYQDVSLGESITPKDRELLRQIDVELNISTTLQNQYILEITSMGKQLAEMSIDSINNVFENSFDFKLHFETAYTSNSMETLARVLVPFMLPKKVRLFDTSVPFAPQVVKSEVETLTPPLKLDNTKPFTDYTKLYETRRTEHYSVYFTILVDTLEEIPYLEDIREYIKRVEELRGVSAIQSIDFLSFLTDLSGFSEVNPTTDTNVQTIRLVEQPSSIACNTFESTLTNLWYGELSKGYPAELTVTTNVSDTVYLDTDRKRSIGNLKLRLIPLKG